MDRRSEEKSGQAIPKMKSVLFLHMLGLFCTVIQCKTVHIYVSPTGSDSNTGLDVTHPIKTLAKAQSKLQESGIAGNIIYVELLHGYHELSSTLHFTRKFTSPVIFRAYQGQEVHVTGGKRIASSLFHRVTDSSILSRRPSWAKGKVLQVHLPAAGIRDYGKMARYGHGIQKTSWLELFINGRATRLAQYPNQGYIDISTVQSTHGRTFTHRSTEDTRWTHEKEPWADGYWYWSWANSAVPVSRIDAHTHSITLGMNIPYGMRPGHFNSPVREGWARQGGYFRMINMLSELDEAGEYYVDRSSGILYVWPNTKDGTLSPTDVVYASMISDCIKVDSAVTNLQFEGFTLEACRRAGFELSRPKRIVMKNLEIKNTGSYGIHGLNCFYITVVSCEIHHTCGGIYISGGVRSSLTPSGIVLSDNHIWEYVRVGGTAYNGIVVRGVSVNVRHNHLHHGQYTGIGWHGNDHVIEYNHLHDTCINGSDCGGMNAGRDWTERGNVIRYNHIHNIQRYVPGAQVRGIMLDDEYSSVTIENNVFYNNEVHTNIGGGRDNIVRYNIFYNATGSSMQVDGRGLYNKNKKELLQRLAAVPYKSSLWASKYPKLANMVNASEPAGNQIHNNVFYNGPQISSVSYTHQHIDIPAFYDVRNSFRSISTTDFWSPGNADFRLRCAAVEWANGANFPQPIGIDQVGPRYNTGPTYLHSSRTTHKASPQPAVCSTATTYAPATSTPRPPYWPDGSAPNTIYPNIAKTGCWLVVSGCPLLRNGTHRDLEGELHEDAGRVEANCLKQAHLKFQFCGSQDGTVTAVFGPTGAMTLSSKHCYFADYGCPSHGSSHAGLLQVDSWGERHGVLAGEEKCLARAHAEWVFCGSDVNHPVTSIYGPTGAFLSIGGGCWIKIKACPKNSKLAGFFYDRYGSTTFNTDKNRSECLARAEYFWQQCGSDDSHPVTAFFRPTGDSKTVP